METPPFHHQPMCYAEGCEHPAIYKIAAPWTDGTVKELKTYGLVCNAHRAELLTAARERRKGLRTADGESLGEVGLYQLMPGVRDRELTRLPDEGL